MLSKRLKELRLEKDILQKDVAKKLNISTSAYGFYEQGKRTPDLTTLELLADYFNVSIDYLLGRTNDKSKFSPAETNTTDDIDIKNPDKLIDEFEVYFMDDEVSEEEKERILRAIQDHYWKSKDLHREKKNKEK